MAKAELLDCLVHLLRRGAFVQQEAGLAAVLLDHAVADETIAHARDHGRLLDLLAHGHDGGQHVLGGLPRRAPLPAASSRWPG
jgi:hypothetical protein